LAEKIGLENKWKAFKRNAKKALKKVKTTIQKKLKKKDQTKIVETE